MVIDAAREVTGWAGVLARVARRSELAGGLDPRGALVGARLLAKGQAGLAAVFRIRAVGERERPAFVQGGRTVRWGEVDARADRLATGLRRKGVGRGDAVALVLYNRPEFFEVEAALARLGASGVSVSWRSTPAELAYLVQHSGAKAVFFEHELAPAMRALRERCPGLDPGKMFAVGGPAEGFARYADALAATAEGELESEDGAVVIYTSGTTGRPKGAVRRFGAGQVLGFAAFLERVPFKRGDRHLCVCPLYHSTALGFAGLALMVGSTVVIEREFEPRRFLETVERERINSVAIVPTMLHRLMALPDEVIRSYRLATLRAVVCVGAQLPAPLCERALSLLGPVLYNVYGATETGLVSVATPDDLRALPGTIGRPLHGVSVRLLDEDGREVPRGEVGELFVRSPMLVEGYHADDEATRASMRDGHFSVGDLARVDEAGRYMIVGRRREMVISGGVNIYPAEVEAVIDRHPAVAQSAVIGVADPEWGERLRAFVVLRGATAGDPAAELKSWCRAELSGPKVPREWVFLDALPANATGKVLKRELAEWDGEVARV